MTANIEPNDLWMRPLAELVDRYSCCGAFVLEMPAYRPDLLRGIAYAQDMRFFDFRAEVMAGHGWQAGDLTLADIQTGIEARMGGKPILVHNVEALLAAHEDGVRRRWLAELLDRDWSHAVVLPLMLYADAVAADHPRRCAIPAEDMPAENLIGRLLNA